MRSHFRKDLLPKPEAYFAKEGFKFKGMGAGEALTVHSMTTTAHRSASAWKREASSA